MHSVLPALGAVVLSSIPRAQDHDHDHRHAAPEPVAPADADAHALGFPLAFGAVIDTVAAWERERPSSAPDDDGFDAAVRLVELGLSAELDERARAWVVLASHDLETPEVEEAAIVLAAPLGVDVTVGHAFIDFGLQMRLHLEALRTLERPLALRTLLGEELAGTGVRLARRFGDERADVSASLGLFADLVGDHDHGHGEHHDDDEGGEPSVAEPGLADLDELAATARLSAGLALGDGHRIAAGGSLRALPDFAFGHDASGLSQDGLDSLVVGADVEWTWRAGECSATAGAEALFAEGDLSAALDDAGTADPADDVLAVADGRAEGLYAFVDAGLDDRTHVGVQWSRVVLPAASGEDASEWDAYVTRRIGSSQRLRLGVTHLDQGSAGDALAVYLQLTVHLGEHAHD